MKELFRGEDGKLHTFKHYFIIKDNFLYRTENLYIEENFKDCFYVVKWGSRRYPEIVYSEKKNNEWIKKNRLLGDGDFISFIDFVADHDSSIICVKGFSKVEISNCLRFLKKEKNMNVEPVVKHRLRQRALKYNERSEALKKD